ncbi:MAG: PHP domain-containing protein [Acutalibacteraceae bacterium]|nr:PHP domain-containing protein [Acutalibacteraceae bacterium]
MSADLHCHSKCSDGATSVKNVIKLAALAGINTVSLTDHDTFKGYEQAEFYGKKFGVKVIHGVEISAYDFDRNRLVHMLCYNCKQPEKFDDMFHKIAESRYKAMIKAMDEIKKRFYIDMEMVEENAKESSTVFKSHIMYTLMEAGYTNRVYGELYKEIFDWKYGFARTKIEYPDVYEIIRLIHSAGGVAVLAHPSVYDTIPAIPKLIENGIDGIECWYPRGSEEDRHILLKYAEKYNLLRTGGTDFHGYSCGRVNPIGTCVTPDEDLKKLLEYNR